MTPPTTTKEDVDMDLFAEDKGRNVEVPPRVAARFSRKPISRRRSSAHSSRCSSLSSRHSRNSALSCHGGPRSTHIAQHLRRASIIESRKARLADRSAHVEQVRLRAAAAEAANRATYSEEKALAAQAAREKLLAEITARCQEEVRRAKQVAKENRAREAAEHARRKEEMEEKFAEAAKRRIMYQSATRRTRTTSLAAVEEKKINPVVLRRMGRSAAARIIQKAWRAWQKRKVAIEFLKIKLSTSQSSPISFEAMTKLVAEESTIKTTKALLKQLDLLDVGNEENADRGAVRVFLSLFIILSHPLQALSHGGNNEQEQGLITKGESLAKLFSDRVAVEAAHGRRASASKTSHEQLQFAFNDFNAAFHTWKSKDLTVLLDVMVGSFVNLDLILQSTKDDINGYVAEDYLQAVRQEQIKLLARLKRLAGPEEALSRVRIAVRKARKDRASKQKRSAPAEHVPRVASDSEVVLDISTTEPLTPPATPSHSRMTVDLRGTSLIDRLGQTMTVLPTNREIAHEIQISGTYEVQQQPWTDSRKTFLDSLKQSMRDSTENGTFQVAHDWTYAMAVLIREKLLNLISQRHPLYTRVDDLLDLKLIDQQSRNNVFSYEWFFESIGHLIAQLCSPGRDEVVKAFVESTGDNTIDRLFTLINIIDLMTLDHINFQFRMASRSVVEHGHEHEFGMFEHDLQEGKHSLELTKRWWISAKSNVPSASSRNASYGSSIYARGLVDLILSNSTLNYTDLPETLRLDWLRLLEIRSRAFHMVAMASILLTTKIRLRRNREAIWATDAEKLRNLDLSNTEPSRIISIIQSGHMMPDSTKEGLLNFVNRVLPTAIAASKRAKRTAQDRLDAIQERRTWNPESQNLTSTTTATSEVEEDIFTEQIATFILKSLREHIFTRLSAASTAERVRITTSAPEVLARVGMPEFVAEVGNLVEILERIRNVDLKAHGKWYDEVAAAVANTSTTATGAGSAVEAESGT